MTYISVIDSGTELELSQLELRARAYAEAARASATLRAYTVDWRIFGKWCTIRQLTTLPATPQTVALFLTDLAQRPATLRRKLAAIAVMHRTAGYETPTKDSIVHATLAGICREQGTASRTKSALLVADLRALLATCGTRIIDIRDQALLLIGFAGALRRSEIVGIDHEDLRFEPEGLVIRLRRSKTNQEGELEEVAILYGSDPITCPVRSLKRWLQAGSIKTGPVFRAVDKVGRVATNRLTARIVGQRIKEMSKRCGLDAENYAAHSLRSGFATSAARANKPELAIMRQGRWKSTLVARRYIRAGSRWNDHAASGIGL